MTWTRQMDAHIARECEGWHPVPYKEATGSTNYGVWTIGTNCMGDTDVPVVTPVPSYPTDPAACIRAAEAWRKQKPGRYWQLTSAGHGWYENGDVERATCYENGPLDEVAGIGDGPSALSQALLRATGGAE